MTENNTKHEINSHNCIIGLLHFTDYCELVTLSDLKDHIAERINHNQYIKNNPILSAAPALIQKEYTLSDYADRRKSTNLTQFEYCPYCGKKIDWKIIKNRKE